MNIATKIKNIPCVILAGGQSKRMGSDKSLLSFQNETTLIKFQYKKLSNIFQNIFISSKVDKFDFPCNIIYDSSKIYSPMVALSSILKTLSNQKVFIIPVDSPFVKEDTIVQMIANSNENYDVTICADTHKVHNLIGIFDRNIIPQIEEMLQNDNHKINHLLSQKLKTRIIYFEDSEQFINLNTPDDLKKVHT